MAKHLVIVESPAKAKTIGKYLGKDYQVVASIGHVRDLPKSKIGVDVDKDFEPQYEVIKGKTDVVKDLKAAAQEKDTVLLASDPDREGEAIAWHIAHLLSTGKDKVKSKVVKRVLFEEITKTAVIESIKSPRDLDTSMFESQQARRILDRLVGYKVSPILWNKVRRGLSAGRVQTVALRIVCEREKEIKAFITQEYWSIVAKLNGPKPPGFSAYLHSYKGERVSKDQKSIANQAQAQEIVSALEKADYEVSSVTKKERQRKPVAPFITSRLQQEASRKLGYQPSRAMKIAQELYEGIDIGDKEGPVGLITYMRTDASRVSPVALEELRGYIPTKYGKEYLPKSAYEYKSGKSAQEAHEAIRPTSVFRDPESIKSFLTKDQYRLYDLIWKRFVASQMVPAIFDQTSVDIKAGEGIFRGTGQIMKFDGFMRVYAEGRDDDQAEASAKDGKSVALDAGKAAQDEKNEDALNADDQAELPELNQGDKLKLKSLTPNQHFTQPPPRFSQATLIKELEEKGIGRPSTYASIMSTIVNKEYVNLDQSKRLCPTDLGILVCDLLIESFPKEFDVGFTARMEDQLDSVSESKLNWVDMMREFYQPFAKTLENAAANMRDVKAQEIPSGLNCPKCNNPLNIRWGRNGEFLACKSYPECKFTCNFERDENNAVVMVAQAEPEVTDVPCPKCSAPTIIRSGKYGQFRGCSAYPKCKYIESIKSKSEIGIKCPICAKGDVVQRRSRWGKFFYGCSEYKKDGGCSFISNYKPVDRACPKCENKYLIIKERKAGNKLACPNEECDFIEDWVEPVSAEPAVAVVETKS